LRGRKASTRLCQEAKMERKETAKSHQTCIGVIVIGLAERTLNLLIDAPLVFLRNAVRV
jgi:hypothetical protein